MIMIEITQCNNKCPYYTDGKPDPDYCALYLMINKDIWKAAFISDNYVECLLLKQNTMIYRGTPNK